jgi:hypothetical protein
MLARPAGKCLVKNDVGQQAQQFGDNAHLPRNDPVTVAGHNGLEGMLGKVFTRIKNGME